MQLRQSTDGGGSYTDYETPVTLNESGNWSYQWTALPSYTSANIPVLYCAAETAPTGCFASPGAVTGDAAGGYTQTIANYPVRTRLTISGIWAYCAQAKADQPASITFRILADGVRVGDSLILTADDAQKDGSWQRTVTGLPVRDSAGNAITYSVVQTDLANYTQSGGDVTGDACSGFSAAFTNTYSAQTSGGGSSGGSGASAAIINPDGSVTTSVTDSSTGTITETTRAMDGTVTTVVTKKDGSLTSSETRADGTTVTSSTTAAGRTTAAVTSSGKTAITVPAALGGENGTVSARITYPDGTKEIVPASYSGGKVSLTVKGSAAVEILDDFVPLSAMPFADVSENAWYRSAVLWAVNKGITNGTAAAAFSPAAICTRAQAVTFLWRAMGSPEPAGTANPFTDVSSGAYYCKAVLWAREKGIVMGTSAAIFSPDAAVTRAQFVTFLWRAAGSPAPTGTRNFTDADADACYYQALQWAAGQGIVVGTTATAFTPAAACTRAQIAVFLFRYAGKQADQACV